MQWLCVTNVYTLTSVTSSLNVTMVVTLRKFISLALSVIALFVFLLVHLLLRSSGQQKVGEAGLLRTASAELQHYCLSKSYKLFAATAIDGTGSSDLFTNILYKESVVLEGSRDFRCLLEILLFCILPASC
ncbi:unnamed protein product [Enterobius vermicularis]|uniref:Dolichyl-diphosphooligosaccharide--protein glycosyltransferase 48 kDa subunit n=1 Tax=Enterobius vermicularis TaxID=51028 RepID=A0A0N4UZX8_ENTVE|nr:unnamed protein product [Enterobius vermicularis]